MLSFVGCMEIKQIQGLGQRNRAVNTPVEMVIHEGFGRDMLVTSSPRPVL